MAYIVLITIRRCVLWTTSSYKLLSRGWFFFLIDNSNLIYIFNFYSVSVFNYIGIYRQFHTIKRLLRISRMGKKSSVRIGAYRRRALLADRRHFDREILRYSLVTIFSDYFRFGHGDWWYNISRYMQWKKTPKYSIKN